MAKREIYVNERNKRKKYFFHETYTTMKEAVLIGKYYKKAERSKYFIDIDTRSNEKKTYFHLYLDNMWNAI